MARSWMRPKSPAFSDDELGDALGRWDGSKNLDVLLPILEALHSKSKALAIGGKIMELRERIVNTPDAWGGPLPDAWKKMVSSTAQRYPSIQQGALERICHDWAWRNR